MRHKRINLKAYAWIIILMLFSTGCMDLADDANPQKGAIDGELSGYLRRNNINAIETPYGFYYLPVNQSGSGIKPEPKDFVSIYYKLQLTNGRFLDSLYSGAPIRFAHLSTDLLPAAINLGVAYMEKGDSYRLFIPAYLAYHDLRIDTMMSAYSNIIADITLLDVADSLGQVTYETNRISTFIKNERPDNGYIESGSVVFSATTAGEGEKPSLNDHVKISYTRKLINNRVLDSKTETFRLGQHEIPGLNEGVSMMKEGESGLLIIPSYKAFWNKAVMKSGYFSTAMVIPPFFAPEIHIPPFSILIYEIELLEVQ